LKTREQDKPGFRFNLTAMRCRVTSDAKRFERDPMHVLRDSVENLIIFDRMVQVVGICSHGNQLYYVNHRTPACLRCTYLPAIHPCDKINHCTSENCEAMCTRVWVCDTQFLIKYPFAAQPRGRSCCARASRLETGLVGACVGAQRRHLVVSSLPSRLHGDVLW
jgi:hypothetical protein